MNDRDHSNLSKTVLRDILSTLVSHWGFREVLATLTSFAELQQEEKPRPHIARASRNKLRPCDMVKRLNVSAEKKALLSQLAQAFEDKEILPTLGHVQNFMAMRGTHGPLPKSRNESFRPLLHLLTTLSAEELIQTLDSHADAGPTRLAPLSEAIESASRIIRGRGTTSDKDNQ